MPFASLLLATAALASASPAGQPERPPYSLLTLVSGHTFPVLNSGPLLDGEGHRLALAISYLSPARSVEEVQAAGDELFEYLRPHAEQQKDKDVIVVARLGSGTGAVDYEVLYRFQDPGGWKRLDAVGRPFPQVAPAPRAGERDVAGEQAALADADAWLALLDASRFKQSWDASAPFLKERVAAKAWAASGKSMRASLGKPLSREPLSLLSTQTVPSAPPGRYVVVEYRSKFAKRPVAFESVTEMLCQDGKWRVAGYAVR